MKKLVIYKLGQLRLYLGVTLLFYAMIDTCLVALSSLLLPHTSLASTAICALSFLISIVVVARHVRCRPLTQNEKKEGLWLQIRLVK